MRVAEGIGERGETLDRGSGSGLSVQGDEERPHPPRFIDRVTPLAGALANFPPYLRSPVTLFLQARFLSTVHRVVECIARLNFGVSGQETFRRNVRGLSSSGRDDYMTNDDVDEVYH